MEGGRFTFLFQAWLAPTGYSNGACAGKDTWSGPSLLFSQVLPLMETSIPGQDTPRTPVESTDVEQEFWIGTNALFALLHMWERDRRDKGLRQRTRSISLAVLQTCIPPGPWLQKLEASLVPTPRIQTECQILPNSAGTCICHWPAIHQCLGLVS